MVLTAVGALVSLAVKCLVNRRRRRGQASLIPAARRDFLHRDFLPIFFNQMLVFWKLKILYLPANGGLAHLARALAWQARGDRFESGILHTNRKHLKVFAVFYCIKKEEPSASSSFYISCSLFCWQWCPNGNLATVSWLSVWGIHSRSSRCYRGRLCLRRPFDNICCSLLWSGRSRRRLSFR